MEPITIQIQSAPGDFRSTGKAAVGVLALSVVGVAAVLAFGPRAPHLPVEHPIRPAAVTAAVPGTGSAATSPGCVMFCDEPAWPVADAHGCQLFCPPSALDGQEAKR